MARTHSKGMDGHFVYLLLWLFCAVSNSAESQPEGSALNKNKMTPLGIKPGASSQNVSTPSRNPSDYMMDLFLNPRAMKGNHIHGFTDNSNGTSDKNLKFHVSLADTENVRFVELSLYKFPSVAPMNNFSTTVNVVDVRTGRVLSAQDVFLKTVGWLKFVLPRKFVKRWIRKPQSNKGIELHTTDSRVAPLIQFAVRETSPRLQPLLVVHCSDRNPKLAKITYVRKPRHRITRSASVKGTCQRRKLNVNFNELGWNHWVIAPVKYSAFHCAGSCLDPNSIRFKNTHARMRVILNARGGSEGPCCAPYKLKPISVLYYGGPGESTYVLKKMKDLVVVECACL